MASTAVKAKAQELHDKMDALKQDVADFAEAARDERSQARQNGPRNTPWRPSASSLAAAL